ncbi:MAG: TetR/AcrR family transcriptional regulator [Armatimonadetes bacterium]|nr:TetR/AcrR family transcriptional regulator [Armatimonadota bacterium]
MKTKEQIVKKALKLFLQKGFHNVSMAMIAAEVGISKPAIYHHFQNKDAMVEGVLDHFTNKMSEWSLVYFKNAPSGEQFLQKMFSAIPMYKNIELILLDEVNETYPNSYNDLLMILSKYKSKFRDRIALDIKGGREKIKQSIIDSQTANSVDKQIDPEKLSLLIHCILEGSAFIAEIDEDLDLNTASGDLFQMTWSLIKK